MTRDELIALAEKHGGINPDYEFNTKTDIISFSFRQFEAFAAALSSATPAVEGLADAARNVLDTELGELACTGSDAPAEDALGKLRDALAASPVPMSNTGAQEVAHYKRLFAASKLGHEQAFASSQRAHSALSALQRDLNVMLASAVPEGVEWVEGYRIKTGALHRIIGTMQEAGYSVVLPNLAFPPPQSTGAQESPVTINPDTGMWDAPEDVLGDCDWPAGQYSRVHKDDPSNQHAPWYVVLPGGSMVEFNHHADDGVDEARAVFVSEAINAALASAPPQSAPQDAQPDYSEMSREQLERHAARMAQALADDRARKFHDKYAFGPMMSPSCLCCGKLPEVVAIKHAELPGIVVCETCRSASLLRPRHRRARRVRRTCRWSI